ncbi:hypothetical protein [Brevibacterium sp. HMSC24B04]|nr:hypothetical protein [Brevibacterium sp. HMSC24B04]OFT94650.1 hypothetical protein HMPREF3092_02090 [Brevibacterium sp. HMSC24B04]
MTKANIGFWLSLAAFIVLFGAFIASGTISGMERDANIYGGPSELIFPISGIGALIAAGVAIMCAVKGRFFKN